MYRRGDTGTRDAGDTYYQAAYTSSFKYGTYSLTAGRTRNSDGTLSNEYFISTTIPLGHSRHAPLLSTNLSSTNGSASLQANVSGSLGENSQYSYNAYGTYGRGDANTGVSGVYRAPHAQLSASASAGPGSKQVSAGISGTVVAHPGGVTFSQTVGDTFGIVEAPGAAGARVTSAPGVKVDRHGYAVVPYLTPYGMNTVDIDPKGTSTDAEFQSTSEQAVPRLGSVGRSGTCAGELHRPGLSVMQKVNTMSGWEYAGRRVCRGDMRERLRAAWHVVCLAFVLLAMSLAAPAHANLFCKTGNVGKVLAAGTLSVPVNTAPGTTISTLAPDAFQMFCQFQNTSPFDTSATNYVDLRTTASLAPGFTDVYQTGIAGLGVRYVFNASPCNASNVALVNNALRLTCPINGPLGGGYMQTTITVTPSLVVTGAIPAGASNLTTVPAVSIDFTMSDAAGTWSQPPLYTGSATGALAQVTCSVSQQVVSVVLPAVDSRAFSAGVGAVAGSKGFALSFACVAGAKVFITLTDNIDPSNRSNTLQPWSGSSSAGIGIGIQILDGKGSLISYGPDSVRSAIRTSG
jgi:hypothetical protein